MKELPGFFKVFLPDTCSERLCIPVAFVKHFRGAFPDKTFLRNRHGKVWPVEVIKVGKDLVFGNGWKKYVEDNSLAHGEFLVFNYDGFSNFHVMLFAITACEKVVAESSMLEVKEELEGDEEKGKEQEEGGREVEDDDNDNDEDEYEVENDDAATNKEEDEDEYEDGDDEDDEEENDDAATDKDEYEEENDDVVVEEEGEQAIKLRKKKRKAKTIKSVGILKKISKATEHCGYQEKAFRSAYVKKIDEDEDIFESGMISRPKNPYFVAKRRVTTRKNELHVPGDVIKDFDIKLPEEIDLLDERKRKWRAKVKQWNDGRIWLTGGWKQFYRWNNLKEEDKCICEFVKGRGGLYLKMCIVRAGSWLPENKRATPPRARS